LNGGFEWVTQGCEIENHLDNKIYLQAMQNISVVPNPGYEDPYSDRCISSHDGKSMAVNKLKLARAAIEMPLVVFIRRASGKNI
jgi:hypothetical protein